MVFIIFLRKGSVRHGIYFEGSAREKRLRNAALGNRDFCRFHNFIDEWEDQANWSWIEKRRGNDVRFLERCHS